LGKKVNKKLFLTKQEDKVVIKNCGYWIGLLGVEDLHQLRQLLRPFKFDCGPFPWTHQWVPSSEEWALLPLAHHPHNPPALPLSSFFGDQ